MFIGKNEGNLKKRGFKMLASSCLTIFLKENRVPRSSLDVNHLKLELSERRYSLFYLRKSRYSY